MNQFKLGVCEWALPFPGPYSFKTAAKLGLKGVQIELGPYEQGFPLSHEQVQNDYMECAERFGIEIPSIGVGTVCDYGLSMPADSAHGMIAIEALKKSVEVAGKMGIPVIQLPSFGESAIMSETDFYNTCEKLKLCCELAARYNVMIASENILNVEDFLRMHEAVGCENLKIMFDTKNLITDAGINEAEYLQALGEFVIQTHLKESFNHKDGAAPLGRGDTNFFETAEAIKETKCSEWLLIENYYHRKPMSELDEDPYRLLAQDIQLVKRTFDIHS